MKTSSLALCLALVAGTTNAFSVNPSNSNTIRAASALSMATNPDQSVFLTPAVAKACVDTAGGSPVYAYSMDKLTESADACLAFPNAYGLTVRYAMKACPNAAILQIFSSKGIHIDASSGYEVRRAMSAGIPAENISLSTQELPADFAELIDMGVKVNCW